MLVHWIWLAHRHGVSDRMKAALLQHFSDPEDIFYADCFDGVEGLSESALESLMDKSLASSEEILEKCMRKDLRILTFQDAAYPRRLKNIPDPPVVLYYKGKLPDWDGIPVIGVVGTRRASAYGLTAAKRMGYQISKCGGIVVSGMASGIDGVAMKGALSADGTVVGVLGCGADVVYPLSNRGLFADTERYGCILSEFPPETPPYKQNFPKRNRIISGLSCGVLVVEAPEKSGSLITARQALDQGRDVFVIPGNIDVASFAGNFGLLRDGGVPVRSGWDILSEYEALYPGKVYPETRGSRLTVSQEEVEQLTPEGVEKECRVAQKPRFPRKKEPSKGKIDKKVIDNGADAPYSDLNKAQPVLNPEEQSIVSALGRESRLIDDVIAGTGLPAHKVLAALTALQIRGIVKKHPGNHVSLK